jgi:signal transduction histidine kinase/ligand-binding sensor domain-containing protein
MLRPAILFFCFLLFSSVLPAQTDAKYRIRQYSTENGMPSNGIKGLQWDETTGFLWIATEAGVVRFNGLDFAVFTKENTPGIERERIAYILKNDKGAIYTTDEVGNVFNVDTSLLKRYNGSPIPNATGFRERHCLSTSDAVLQKKMLALIKKTTVIHWIKLLQADNNSCVIIDVQRNFFYTSAANNEFIKLALPSNISNGMMIDGKIFFIDAQKRVYAPGENFSIFEEKKILLSNDSELKLDAGNSLLFWESGMKNPILFSGSNAWLLRDKKTHIEASLICSVIPSFSFIRYAQYSEKNKTLFIGTDSKGIILINENRVHSMRNKETDIWEVNSYYSQIALPSGNVLTNAGHIIGTSTTTDILPIKDKFNFTVHTSGDSLLWYTQYIPKLNSNCLHQYNYKTKQTVIFPKIPVLNDFAITNAENGATYIGTDKGFGLLQHDSIQFLFNDPSSKKMDASAFNILELTKGVFVAASCKGLLRYNTITKKIDTILNLPGYCVRAIWKYQDYLFIGTYGKGYYIYKNGRLKQMPLDKNRFLLYSHCFVPDEFGFCWISTNRGLFKAQLSDIINGYEKNNPHIYYHYFGKNDGMETTEMNGGCAPCALVLKNKTISFPTMDGLLWVDPAKANPLLPDGAIYIDEFRTGNKIKNLDSLSIQSLPAKPGDINIRISFSAWCNKENIYVEYRLNKSKDWIPVETGNAPIIKLSNLPSGKYKLELRKVNGFGIDNYSYKEINFSISTPWNQQWWFYILATLVVTGIVALYFRIRTNQFKIRQRKLELQVSEKTKELQDKNEILEKNNTIKTRLISIISHDIVTPLKFVTAAGKNLIEKRKMMPEELQKETIQEMTNTSQELHLLSTNILNWIKYQNENRRMTKEIFSLHEMVKQVLGILNSLAHQKNLRIVNDINPELTIYQFYEPLKILVYNLLTNAIHFSERGTITIRAEQKQSNIFLSVQDEGSGMPPEKIQSLMEDHVVISSANVDNKKGHGLGFLIIKDLLKTVGASLHIESTVGVGSKISIIIPV